MRLAPRLARAEGAVEMLDAPAAVDDLRQCLADVARLNGVFGGRRLTVKHVEQLAARVPAGRPLTVLDIGTGGADLPRALVRWARRRGRGVRVFALDRDATTVGVAGGWSRGYPEIAFVQGDALDLPFGDASVDVVVSALTLHHFDADAAARHLAEMDRVARHGVLVNDLARSRTAWVLVWLATRALARNHMARHDGPLSVRRAYVRGELRSLCEKAGLHEARIVRYPMLLRQCVVRRK